MRIDGKSLRDKIKTQLQQDFLTLSKKCTLAIVVVGDNPVINNFVNLKKKFAREVGVSLLEKRFPTNLKFSVLEKVLASLGENKRIHGIIVQLPLPPHLDPEIILNQIPVSKDVDLLSSLSLEKFERGQSLLLPPVVGAIKEICQTSNLQIRNKHVLVVGHGRLVGQPAAIWFKKNGAKVQIVDNSTSLQGLAVDNFEIIVCGAGSAGIIKPEMVRPDVVLIDAGTSESKGMIVGDVDPNCEQKAKIFTPVPGGIGPITVAMIFKNLYLLNKQKQKPSVNNRGVASKPGY